MTDDRRPGRPRSERARQAVLTATAGLVTASGYDVLTIDAIAEKAGVGRQTIYRWWSSKASIIAEAVLDGALAPFDVSAYDDLDPHSLLHSWVEALRVPTNAALVRALSAAAASDAADSAALYEHATRASHAALASALRRGQVAGTIRAHLDAETVADALTGALLYRILTRVPMPDDYAESLLRPFDPRSRRESSRR
ncbi:TetR/AcrR family transcriptional regulator [Nocardia vaccinii]|uniref:TetR/AcrR family transcriptional regulator n=1 Tax=Nocardia vaccinii TaxID=1822 RepID=UPI000836D29E|nr:TetR/AcrR family transcriptional regulator [Nocardia vaccinii]